MDGIEISLVKPELESLRRLRLLREHVRAASAEAELLRSSGPVDGLLVLRLAEVSYALHRALVAIDEVAACPR